MICSNCGTQNIDGVTFCGSCGAQMEPHIQRETHVQNQQDGGFQPQNAQSGPPPPPPPAGAFQQPSGSSYSQSSGSQYSQPGGQYTPPPYGNPSNGGMVPPKNYMVESIIVTIISTLCCCSPISTVLGIIAIVKANNVNTEFERGNVNEAINCSQTAKNLSLWAAIIAVIFSVIGTIAYVIWGAALLSASGFPY